MTDPLTEQDRRSLDRLREVAERYYAKYPSGIKPKKVVRDDEESEEES